MIRMVAENKSIGERGSEAYLKLSEYANKIKLKNSGAELDGLPSMYTLKQAKEALIAIKNSGERI